MTVYNAQEGNGKHDKTKFVTPFITNPKCNKIQFFSTSKETI